MKKHTQKYKKSKKKIHKKSKKYVNKRTNKRIKKIKNTRKYKGGNLNNFLQCYEKNLEKVELAIREYNGIHALNEENKINFINNQYSEIRRRAAKDLVDNTIYITLNEVDQIIENLIDNFYSMINENGDINKDIYMFSGKPDKSFYFLCVLALKHIKRKGYKEPIKYFSTINNQILGEIGDNPLIILDDVSYSGSQLSKMLNDIFYNSYINKLTIPNIYVMLIAVNKISYSKLLEVPIEKSRSGVNLKYTKTPFKIIVLEDKIYNPLISTIGLERYFYINLFFSIFTVNLPNISIYLDHKLADDVSTYKKPLMYGPIVPTNYNYEIIINNIQYDFITSKIDNETLIKLIDDFNNDNGEEIERFKSTLKPTSSTYKSIEDNKIKKQISVYSLSSIVSNILINKLKREHMDIPTDIDTNAIRFYPLINNCLNTDDITRNINDSEIQHYDYLLFMIPEGCFDGSSDNCAANLELINETLEIYLQDISKSDRERLKYISDTINNIASCPTSWYKNGNFKMDCPV